MQRVLALAEGVARTPATVLISGESGTGKEVLARLIHARSPRAHRPLVAINCGALPASLIESELFGHERGAFSGATERRIGRIESAHGGTLLLDEISEMPIALQTRLLRVLQEREVHRVGGHGATPVDIRVVATTNRDLHGEVVAGRFREDLYYRVHVFPIHVPPLRERMVDLPALAAMLLARHGARLGLPSARFSETALAALMRYPFPGNIRQLGNMLERAVILCQGRPVAAEHLLMDAEEPAHYRPQAAGYAPMAPTPFDAYGTPPRSRAEGSAAPHGVRSLGGPNRTDGGDLKAVERNRILSVLTECAGNRTHASRHLGISVRTLRNRLREYRSMGLNIPAPGRGVATEATAAPQNSGGRVVHLSARGAQ